MRQIGEFFKHRWVLLAGMSLLLITPQILVHGLILGGATTPNGDSIFHFNRIYDAAMQIKTGHFSYFVSNFGFDQSGRIVNAFYGAFSAYFYGAILLITGNWFGFELVTSFLIIWLAGIAFERLGRFVGLSSRLSLVGALFYMNSSAVMSWASAQKGAALAAAILPFLIMAGVAMMDAKRLEVRVLLLAMPMSLLWQIHNLTAVMSVLMLVPMWLHGFVYTAKRWLYLRQTLLAVGLTLILTANVWGGMLQVMANNALISTIPFPLAAHAVLPTTLLSGWLGLVMSVIVVLQISFVLLRFRHMSQLNRLLTALGLGFVWLASPLVPWVLLERMMPALGQYLQFPSRFMLIATPLLLIGFFLSWQEKVMQVTWQKSILSVLLALLVIGNWHLIGQKAQVWQTDFTQHARTTTKKDVRTELFQDNTTQTRRAWASRDLQAGLKSVWKGTPDYLPSPMTKNIWQTTVQPYRLALETTYANPLAVRKKALNDGVQLQWTATQTDKVLLPVVKYKQTQLVLNGQPLGAQAMTLNAVGGVQIKPRVGKNTLQVVYAMPTWTKALIGLALVGWGILGSYGLWTWLKKKLWQ
ncbi:MAG TPA: hypothetical protein VGM95_03995 [Lactobacillaceae bacterium]|jgi:hypothetical protein